MRRKHLKAREEARRQFLTGEVETNAEIAARLGVKPHTVGKWRKEESWDDLRLKVDRQSAERLVESLAGERTNLNLRHYKYWDVLLSNVGEVMKRAEALDIREQERLAQVIDKAQKGQRLARGLSLSGETEEQIRAQSQAEARLLIDAFIDAVKEHVSDEEVRDRIRLAVLSKRGIRFTISYIILFRLLSLI